jgi:hypothetical protein
VVLWCDVDSRLGGLIVWAYVGHLAMQFSRVVETSTAVLVVIKLMST